MPRLAPLAALLLAATPCLARDAPLAVGDAAPAVTLPTLDGTDVDLGERLASGTTVVVVLRGYPGYPCPLCSRQAAEYRAAAGDFEAAGVDVVLVYPGAAGGLEGHATEFVAGDPLPAPVTLTLDPDYDFSTAWGLRWDAPNETAYPSTFVVTDGVVTWATISRSHGGRVKATAALAAATR